MKSVKFSALVFVLFTLCSPVCLAQEEIALPAPDFPRTVSLGEALQQRRSERDFSNPAPLSDQVLSNLLWAACGISSDEGKITAPSAMNRQDICVYVCREDGAYRYDASRHVLLKVSDKDLRQPIASRQSFAAQAPVCLLIASDLSRFERNAEQMGTVDAGYVSQNICLACVALGLKTVPRMTMDQAALHSALNLPEKTLLILNHPVGYK